MYRTFGKFFTLVVFSLVPVSAVFAFQTARIDGVQVAGDFVVSPAKQEVVLGRGEVEEMQVSVLNRSGARSKFHVSSEGLSLSDNGRLEELGTASDNGFASIAFADRTDFVLEHGEQATILVKIKAPFTAPEGDIYGSIMIAGEKMDETEGTGSTRVITRAGSVFYIRIPWAGLKESGEMVSFEQRDGGLSIGFRNSGNTYLSPYGVIEIRNIFGGSEEKRSVLPWQILPGAEKENVVPFLASGIIFPRKALAVLYPGYGGMDNVQIKYLWVLPSLPIIALDIAALLAVVFFAFKLKKRSYGKERNNI